jgi:hypothetical protein
LAMGWGRLAAPPPECSPVTASHPTGE